MAQRKRRGRPVNGLVLLDKPTGITSNRALQIAKNCYNAAKAGHTGSLDPLASGMLPICFGEATKFSQLLLDADKSYEVQAKLGVTTDTGDAEGTVLTEKAVDVTNDEIAQALQQFLGEIKQIPPMYSALKKDGQPLYKLARQGIEVERKPRDVRIYNLDLLDITLPYIRFSVSCSKGTYVRTLVEDLGAALGCGAHVTELRRTTISSLGEYEMHPLAVLEKLKADKHFEALDALLLPVDVMLMHWPKVTLDQNSSYYLLQGQAVTVPSAELGQVRIYDESEAFIGIGEMSEDGQLQPKRLLSK